MISDFNFCFIFFNLPPHSSLSHSWSHQFLAVHLSVQCSSFCTIHLKLFKRFVLFVSVFNYYYFLTKTAYKDISVCGFTRKGFILMAYKDRSVSGLSRKGFILSAKPIKRLFFIHCYWNKTKSCGKLFVCLFIYLWICTPYSSPSNGTMFQNTSERSSSITTMNCSSEWKQKSGQQTGFSAVSECSKDVLYHASCS